MIQKVDHITINVKNLEETIAFYQKILGLEYLKTISMDDHSLTYLKLGEGIALELISYDTDTGEIQLKGVERGSFRHLALETENIQELYKRILKSESTVVRMEPSYIEKLESWRMLAEDPNGVELEFVQYETINQ